MKNEDFSSDFNLRKGPFFVFVYSVWYTNFCDMVYEKVTNFERRLKQYESHSVKCSSYGGHFIERPWRWRDDQSEIARHQRGYGLAGETIKVMFTSQNYRILRYVSEQRNQ